MLIALPSSHTSINTNVMWRFYLLALFGKVQRQYILRPTITKMIANRRQVCFFGICALLFM